MTDTLKRLAGPVAVTGSAATIYTVPASTTTTVTSIHIANETGSNATFTMSIGTDGAGKRLFFQVVIYANDVLHWTGLIVLAAAEILQVLSGTASALTVTVSGVEVT